MKQIFISVEGQTEETFIREVIAPHLVKLGLYIKPILLKTKRIGSQPTHKGGFPKYTEVKKQLLSLLGNTNVIAVTTLYDMYALPSDFPGVSDKPNANGYRKVKHIEQAFLNDISHPHFHPYLQLHEFEALLFVDPDITAQELGLPPKDHRKIQTIREKFRYPEDINDTADNCPSRRLLRIVESYDKTTDGPLVVLELPLAKIRQSCPHFNEWLSWLESLGSSNF